MITALAVTIAPSFAAPLNAWGGAQARHTAAAVATNYASFDGSVAPTLYGGLGLANGDVWTGFGFVGNVSDGTEALYTLDVMPRWFPSDSLAICPRLMYTQGDAATVVGLEVHHIASAGKFALTTNVGWHPTVGSEGLSAGDLALLVGPEIYLTERVSLAAEMDFTSPVGAASDTSADFAPAISAVFDRDGNHSAAVGAVVPVWPERGAPTIGAWYSVVFGTGGHAVAAADSE
jgi:hypothetical protein